MSEQKQQRSFVRVLSCMAAASGRELRAEVLELWDELVVQPYGDAAALAALKAWLTGGEGRGDVPSVRDVLRHLDPTSSPRLEAADLAGRMLAAIGRRGYTWPQTFHYDGHASFADALTAELGPKAAAVVEISGGWNRFCESFGDSDNARPQLRELCELEVNRERHVDVRRLLPDPKERMATPKRIGAGQ